MYFYDFANQRDFCASHIVNFVLKISLKQGSKMAKFGFLSHSDMSIYFFRSPIMRRLQQLGHEVVAIFPDGEYSQAIKKEFNVAHYELDKASLNPLKIGANTRNLSEILRGLNLDFLQTSAHKSNVFGTFAARRAGIKHILNLVEVLGSFYIDNDVKTRAVRFVMEMLYRRAFAMSDGCVFVNDSNPAYFVKHGIIAPQKVIKIKSVGVDTAKFDRNLYQNLDFNGKKVILMMGRALWHKGVREFYEAAEILKERKDCVFVFVGSGFAGNKSSADETFLHTGAVKFMGWQKNTADYYKSAYIFALPSYKEGFAMTIMEAMSMGVPVVASRCEGNEEAVIDGRTGLLCDVCSGADLARKIEILLDDENLARKMGEEARKVVCENYDTQIIVQKYIDVYRKFIDV